MTRSFELMGVLNVTPDSFSDGGYWLDPDAAVAHGIRLAGEGATILDIGGESTRPGAEPVSEEEEIRRTQGVIRQLAQLVPEITLSIDTMKASVAAAAIEAGASYVNDVSAMRGDPEMASVVADHPQVRVCLMHMRGEPRTMQHKPEYDDVVTTVVDHLAERITAAQEAGITLDRIDVDPGIGFGKTIDHNLELLRNLDRIAALGRPVVLGTSRKTFIGTITGRAEPAERAIGTVATAVLAYRAGVRTFRVHDVAAHRDALLVAEAIINGR